MASTRGRPSNRARAARALSERELLKEFQFESSNSTTAAFLGGKAQKDWMTAAASKPFRPSITINSNSFSPKDNRIEGSSAVPLSADKDDAIASHDFSQVPFPPDFDRGRFPLQRRRRGGAQDFPGRPQASIGSNVTSSAATSPSKGNRSAGKLPNPSSPSVTPYRQSITIIDLEDEVDDSHADQGPLESTVDHLTAEHGAQGMEGRRHEADKTRGLARESIPTSGAHVEGPFTSHEDATHLENGISPTMPLESRMASGTSKRSSEDTLESRKRPQNIPGQSPGPPQPIPNAVQEVAVNIPPNLPPLESEMRVFHQIVTIRGNSITLQNRRGNNSPEQGRLGLLRDACTRSDCFYLCLHQLYCREYASRARGIPLVPLKETHRQGLEVLTQVLVSNKDLTVDALDWFANFPIPSHDLLIGRPAFQIAHEHVLSSLPRLATNWETLRTQCDYRGHPPLVEELTELLGVHSFTTQQVIFRALLRRIWDQPQDHCFQLAEDLFLKAYREVINRQSTHVYASEAHARVYVREFQRIKGLHQPHVTDLLNRDNIPTLLGQPNQTPPTATESSVNMDHSRHRSQSSQFLAMTAEASRARVDSSTPTLLRPASSLHSRLDPHSTQTMYSPTQTMTTNGVQSSRGDLHSHSPANSQHLQYQGVYRTPTYQVHNMQPMVDQNMPARGRPSGSLPSEIVQRQVQNVPQGFPVHQVLPSNVPGQVLTQSRPENRTPQLQSSGPIQLQYHGENHQEAYRRRVERPLQVQAPSTGGTELFIRANPNLSSSQVNPALNALHQAHLQSPVLCTIDVQGRNLSIGKLCRYISHVIMPPGVLSGSKKYIGWEFSVEQRLADTFVKDMAGFNGALPSRILLPGSRLCRIRCIIIGEAATLPSQGEWAVADNVWPNAPAIVLNGEALEVRRKSHHGKDLAIDVTAYVKAGKNEIATSIIGFPEGSTSQYAIGVEIIQVVQQEVIRNGIPIIPWEEARQKIIDRCVRSDSDVQIVNAHSVIDLTDPFMARIFDVPVRGTSCRHSQCFDRDVFLQTRNSKNTKEPCGPDEFRCPVCGSDARPQSLVIDGFFVMIRNELERRGRLNVKSIILYPNGGWEIKEEDEIMGEQGDGSGRRKARNSTPRDVISIDDD